MAKHWNRIEVGLVLQGGGALGAYEWGAIESLFGLMDEVAARGTTIGLRVVTGVSIGAINGACIVGAKDRGDGLLRLAALWNDLKLETPFHGRFNMPFNLPSFSPARDLSLLGLPGFYVPRTDIWKFWRWTSYYDTEPLEATLRKHVSFENIDSSETTFVVTAVDVTGGTLKRFRNRPVSAVQDAKRTAEQKSSEHDAVVKPFTPRHILASGSLAPQFPWTEIGGRLYWDGGIVDNTPLGDAMEAFSEDNDVYRLLVVMNLYPLTANKPDNLLDVTDRVHELSYGNRLRQDRAGAKRINKLARAVEQLAKVASDAKVPLTDTQKECVAYARHFKIAKTVEVDLQKAKGPQDPTDDADGLRDFSPETVDRRRADGRERATHALTPVFIKEGFLPEQPARHAAAPMEN
jgi:NTE family protein